jgi:hypothetical protein
MFLLQVLGKYLLSMHVLIHLKHTISSGSGTLFSYSMTEKIFFLYKVIEKSKLYLSMLFDHTSYNVIVISIR